MERKVGEVFKTKEGCEYVVIEGNNGCKGGCSFCGFGGSCESPEDETGLCQNFYRDDKRDVRFRRIFRKKGLIGVVIYLKEIERLRWGLIDCRTDKPIELTDIVVYIPLMHDICSINSFNEFTSNSLSLTKRDLELQQKYFKEFCDKLAV